MLNKADFEKQSDEQLMNSYIKDEMVAFEVLYSRYSAKVLGYLTQKTRSPKQAQDLMQEAFLKLHRSRHLYKSMLPFAPWLFSITRSVFLDFAKKKSLEDVTEIEKFDNLSVIEASQDTVPDIDLSSLSATQKQVVALRVYDEATFEEIADRLSTTPDNARQIFSRAVKSLKSVLASGSKK